jgi:hypothetical protein
MPIITKNFGDLAGFSRHYESGTGGSNMKTRAISLICMALLCVGLIILLSSNGNNSASETEQADYGGGGRGTHLLIDKGRVTEIISENEFVVSIIRESDKLADKYDLLNDETVKVVCSETNQRAIDFIRKLHIGSIAGISRFANAEPNRDDDIAVIECYGIDIFDEDGTNVIEYY